MMFVQDQQHWTDESAEKRNTKEFRKEEYLQWINNNQSCSSGGQFM